MHEHTHKEDVSGTASGHDASRFDSRSCRMFGTDMCVRCAGAAGLESRRSSVAFVLAARSAVERPVSRREARHTARAERKRWSAVRGGGDESDEGMAAARDARRERPGRAR